VQSEQEAPATQESPAKQWPELHRPEVDRYLQIQQHKYLKEFGAMLPTNVHCMPGQTALKFLK